MCVCVCRGDISTQEGDGTGGVRYSWLMSEGQRSSFAHLGSFLQDSVVSFPYLGDLRQFTIYSV